MSRNVALVVEAGVCSNDGSNERKARLLLPPIHTMPHSMVSLCVHGRGPALRPGLTIMRDSRLLNHVLCVTRMRNRSFVLVGSLSGAVRDLGTCIVRTPCQREGIKVVAVLASGAAAGNALPQQIPA